jgi:hypothetical protein
MSMQRLIAPLILLSAVAVAACGGTSGSPSASTAPSAAPSASAAPSDAASPSAAASASPAASADTGGDVAGLIPATVGDVAMSVTEVDADAYIAANVGKRLGPVLTALGKAPTDVTVATATGSTTGGATLFIDAVRVAGSDATALLEAFQTAASAVPGAAVEAVDVDGTPTVQVTTPSYTLAVAASGDTLLYVQSPDPELVTAGVAALS